MSMHKHPITTTIATLLFGGALTLSPAWAGDRDKQTEMPASEHQAEATKGVTDKAEGAERSEGERSTDEMPASEHQEDVVEDTEKDDSGAY
ncbi:hypothetical protein [Spectribacter hydrogenoxidans]|uniref:Uncharacterized protein n=1 Tax=Spectribacter hydrogenoxidans TaxID=3075608 RepID=A0ABU3BWT6_9GAMM|nr:hypothetical protein [Salinisphaera sp. W335]MDT0633695.1 hypothetical protein [Salinisphaera sp. W335]